jgi:nitroimidazol reductase NimA-like FMN-containing flavoprotein (pyridoxamine 5'-phosphate oxidase superfamily)
MLTKAPVRTKAVIVGCSSGYHRPMKGEPSERTRLQRKADRGHYDRGTVYSIIDQGLVCHLGVTLDGQPTIIPATYGRLADHLYVHGSQANRVLKALAQGIEACVEITVLDGVVLGRSPMRHSMNYRSVVIYGSFQEVLHEHEKLRAIKAILEHVVPGRLAGLRTPTTSELKRTRFLALPLRDYSAKIREGRPTQDADDDLNVWSGVIPLRTEACSPVAADEAAAEVGLPAAVKDWPGQSSVRVGRSV